MRLLTGKELGELDLENEEDVEKVLGTDVAARVESRQKMDLIKAAQAGGEAVGPS